MSVVVFADVNDVFSGYWINGAKNLTIGVDSSASGYLAEVNYGRNEWNGINTDVSFNTTVEATTFGTYDLKIFCGDLNKICWTTRLYDSSGTHTMSGQWRNSYVYLDIDSLNYFTKLKVIVHELGHVLGLAHPYPESSHALIDAIMKQRWNGYTDPK